MKAKENELPRQHSLLSQGYDTSAIVKPLANPPISHDTPPKTTEIKTASTIKPTARIMRTMIRRRVSRRNICVIPQETLSLLFGLCTDGYLSRLPISGPEGFNVLHTHDPMKHFKIWLLQLVIDVWTSNFSCVDSYVFNE